MSKAQHTPGPWTILRDTYGANVSGARHCIMPPEFDAEQPKNKWPFSVASVSLASKNCEANARLIAAAPDLLAALKLAKSILARECQVPEEECVGGDFVTINAAIAKATSEASP